MSTQEAEMASSPPSPPSPPLSHLASMFHSLLLRRESSVETLTHALAVFNPATRTLSIFRGPHPDLAPLFEAKSGQPPASRASIEALPRVLIAEDDWASSDCAICLEEYAAGNEAREMPCRHRFHSGCIEKWLLMHGTCPVCRFTMLPEADPKAPGEGGEDWGRSQRLTVLMLVINGRDASIRVPVTGRWVMNGIRDQMTVEVLIVCQLRTRTRDREDDR